MFWIAFIRAFLIFVSALYLAFSGMVEKEIVYKPSKLIRSLKLNAEIQEFTTKDNLKLSYLHIKGTKKSPIILFCHGNEGNVTLPKNQEKLLFLANKGYEIYALDYRGYGKSGGTPDEKGIYSDIREFIKYLKIKPGNAVIWGHSLGAAVAIDAAVDLKFKGVIEEGGFTSIDEMKTYRIEHDDKGNPVSNFMRDAVYNSLKISQNFDSKAKVADIKSPLLIIHGKKDNIVPYEMGVALSRLNKNSILFLSDSGTHNGIGWQNNAVLKFIEKL